MLYQRRDIEHPVLRTNVNQEKLFNVKRHNYDLHVIAMFWEGLLR